MSAGFEFADEVFWGTNGAIERYVAMIAEIALTRYGAEDPLTLFFQAEQEGFYQGKVVFLQAVTQDTTARNRFLAVLDSATEALLQKGVFTDYGREWVETTMSWLRANIASGNTIGPNF